MRKAIIPKDDDMSGKYGWNSSMVCIGQVFGETHSRGWERKEAYYELKKLEQEIKKVEQERLKDILGW